MGLIKNAGEEKYAVLSDILGDEDHLGDMTLRLQVLVMVSLLHRWTSR